MTGGYVLSVTQLNEYVASLISNDALMRDLSLRGEISGFKRHSSGHLYFSLKDEASLVRCVMFRQNAMSLRTGLADGMEIVARGYASLFTRDGQFQFYVKSIETGGEGELYKRFLKMKAKLEAEGLFDPAHKKELPLLPKAVGVVTSETGAVIRDIVNVAHRRYPMMDIVLCPARVQGMGAAEDIAEAIRVLDRSKKCDVMIVGRGGGSMEDLWAFNEEAVARAIYEAETPIVSAVGHETDFTVADFVADMRAPTPSAAAELAVPEYEALSADVEDKLVLMRRAVTMRMDKCRSTVEAAGANGAFRAAEIAIAARRGRLEQTLSALEATVREAANRGSLALGSAEAKLVALSPERTLERGYAIVSKEGRAVSGIAALSVGERAKVTLSDGEFTTLIESIKEKERDGD